MNDIYSIIHPNLLIKFSNPPFYGLLKKVLLFVGNEFTISKIDKE